MWLSLHRLVGVLSPFPILIACASAGAHDANVITAPELSRSKARNAYDAIHQIRPEMLRTRDPGTMCTSRPASPLSPWTTPSSEASKCYEPFPPARWPGSNTSTLGWRPRDLGRDSGTE